MRPIKLLAVPISLKTPQDKYDCQFMQVQSPTDLREFGRRYKAGSSVLRQAVAQDFIPSWVVTLGQAWANVNDGVLFKAEMEDWSPEQVRDFLGLTVEIPKPEAPLPDFEILDFTGDIDDPAEEC